MKTFFVAAIVLVLFCHAIASAAGIDLVRTIENIWPAGQPAIMQTMPTAHADLQTLVPGEWCPGKDVGGFCVLK